MPSTESLPEAARRWLLARARQVIMTRLQIDPLNEPGPPPAVLNDPAACFVTLTRNGQLRGCIGTLEAREPLQQAIAHYAESAAFEDPRFPPLTAAEWPSVEVEISVLSPPEPIRAESETALLAQLQPGLHGLIIESGAHRATFLPQVWDQLPQGHDFLRQLKRKAGLADDYPVARLNCSIYTVIHVP